MAEDSSEDERVYCPNFDHSFDPKGKLTKVLGDRCLYDCKGCGIKYSLAESHVPEMGLASIVIDPNF